MGKKNKGGRKTKLTPEVFKTIIELKESTDLAIYEICERVGIYKATYFDWMNTNLEFSDAIKRAEVERLERTKIAALKMGFKKLEGYDVEETKTEYINKNETITENGKIVIVSKPQIKSKTITKKHITGSDTLIMYYLNNLFPEKFKHKEHFDHTTKGEKIHDLSHMTTEELIKRGKAMQTIEKDEKG